MKIKFTNPLKWPLKRKIISLIMITVLGGGGWIIRSKQTKNNLQEPLTATVARGNLVNSVTLSGQVEQSNLISVFTKASGVVSKVYVTNGQEVKAGEKLAEITLDSEGKNNQAQAWSSYLSAKNSVDSASAKQWNLESSMWSANDNFIHNAVDLDKAETSSEYIQANREWLAAEASYKNQEQVVAQSKASLNQAWYSYTLYQSTITAPVDGVIIGLNLAEGLTVSGSTNSSGGAVSQTVATIKTSGTPVASFTATEVDINQIESDQIADVTMDSIENEVFEGKVVAVDRVGEVTSGVTQYTVLISINTESDQVLPNMAAAAEIVFDSRENVLVVPADAVATMGDKSMVRVVNTGEVQPTPVEVGLQTDTQVEILSGLEEGDEVITTSATGTGENREMDGPPTGGMIPGMGGGMMRH